MDGGWGKTAAYLSQFLRTQRLGNYSFSGNYTTIGNAMDELWRGLKGAIVGAGIAGIFGIAEPVLCFGFLTLAALTGFLVVGIARVAARLPRKSVRMLKRSFVVAGCVMLASPFVVMALRNWGVELPDLPYTPPILAGLLGGVIVLVYEAGVAARPKADADSENHTKVIIHDSRILEINRRWLWVSLVAWFLAAGLLSLSWLRQEPTLDVFFGTLPFCLLWGGIMMLYFVGIPLRIALNLIIKERRRERLWETVMCVIAFLTLTLVFVLGVLSFPPDW